MSVLFSIVLPVFALIVAGWGARRFDLLGPTGAYELNRFVVYLGMPALLFQVVAKASWHDLHQPGFTAAFGLGCALIFAATVAARRWQGVPLADASLEGLNAGYANVGFIGFPLCMAAFGPASMTSVTITAILTVCVLFGIAVAIVEIGVQEGCGWAVLGKVAASLAKTRCCWRRCWARRTRPTRRLCPRGPTVFSACWPAPPVRARWCRWACSSASRAVVLIGRR